MYTKFNVISFCAVLLNCVIISLGVPVPQNAYDYLEKVQRGESPVEDHSEHLAAVATAYKETDKNYNNYLDRDTLQRILIHQEGVVQEKPAIEEESLDSSLRTKYENTQQSYGKHSGKQPLLDTIQEHEKYGNDGDKFYFITDKVVRGYQAFGNFINASFEGPSKVFSQLTRLLTGKLDKLGGQIVGLR